MQTPETGTILIRGAEIVVLTTVAASLLLYSIIHILRFGNSSLIRCVLASAACSAVVLICLALSAILSVACGPIAGLFLIFSLLIGIVLTLPAQLLVFRLPAGRGVIIWIVYIITTPLILCWMVLFFAWAGLFRTAL